MTDGDGPPMWPAAMFEQFQETSEQAAETQAELLSRFMEGGMDDVPALGRLGMGSAVFKTRVQSGGRISIPDAEREALDIEEGDIVQSIVIPIKRNRDSE